MTLLVSWVSKDDKPTGKETSALYIGSDSRYSWSPVFKKYDNGPKTFACRHTPDIFGFCGDVTFCTMVITQLKNLIDSGCLFHDTDGIEEKTDKVRNNIRTAILFYPRDSLKEFSILHGSRVRKEFALNSFSYSPSKGFSYNREIFPETSNKVFIGGSGGEEFKANWILADSDRNNNSHTSRNILHCLDYTIRNIKDKATGGYPQVVGLYRGGNGRIFGIISENKRFIGGIEVGLDLNLDNIEWRNSDFERMDPISLQRLQGVSRHYF